MSAHRFNLTVLSKPWAAPATGSVLLNRLMDWLGGERHRLDPDVDHAGRLMNLRADDPMYTRYGVTRDMLWASGNPQNALREMHAWCGERSLPMVVILWPFLQGLETDQTYPFQKLHDLVREFCASEKIPFLDLLPGLKGHASSELWVAPYDQHGNPKAQELVSSPITRFLIQHCNFEDR